MFKHMVGNMKHSVVLTGVILSALSVHAYCQEEDHSEGPELARVAPGQGDVIVVTPGRDQPGFPPPGPSTNLTFPDPPDVNTLPDRNITIEHPNPNPE